MTTVSKMAFRLLCAAIYSTCKKKKSPDWLYSYEEILYSLNGKTNANTAPLSLHDIGGGGGMVVVKYPLLFTLYYYYYCMP